MKKLFCIILAIISLFCSQTRCFAQISQKEYIERCLGTIRADVLRYACETLEVYDTSLTNCIDTLSLNHFKKQVNQTDNDVLKQISGYFKVIDGSNPTLDNYLNLNKTIDSVCALLKTKKGGSIDKKKNEFHESLAASVIECYAFQSIKLVGESDSGYVRKQFEKIFSESSSHHSNQTASTGSISSKTETGKRGLVGDGNGGLGIHIASTMKNLTKYIILTLLLLAIVFVYYWFVIRPKISKKNETIDEKESQKSCPNDKQQQNMETTTAENSSEANEELDDTTKTTFSINKDKGFIYDDVSVSIIGASVIGKSHISMNLPCQDSCGYENLGNGWGIAITSDGAGSAEHSDIGSKIVVSRALEHFKQHLAAKNWQTTNYIPTDAEWAQLAYNSMKAIYDDTNSYSKKQSLELKSLSATIIVIIHTPYGLLTCHVGDGRAGYKNSLGEWISAITPHKGEEANQTIFLTSDFWSVPNYVMSGVFVPECRVIRDKVTAFALMSDGCESASWLYNQQNENGRFYDPNIPFSNFFDPITAGLKKMREANISPDDKLTSWHEFLANGKNFANEPDDKTMILGLILQ